MPSSPRAMCEGAYPSHGGRGERTELGLKVESFTRLEKARVFQARRCKGTVVREKVSKEAGRGLETQSEEVTKIS